MTTLTQHKKAILQFSRDFTRLLDDERLSINTLRLDAKNEAFTFNVSFERQHIGTFTTASDYSDIIRALNAVYAVHPMREYRDLPLIRLRVGIRPNAPTTYYMTVTSSGNLEFFDAPLYRVSEAVASAILDHINHDDFKYDVSTYCPSFISHCDNVMYYTVNSALASEVM